MGNVISPPYDVALAKSQEVWLPAQDQVNQNSVTDEEEAVDVHPLLRMAAKGGTLSHPSSRVWSF